MGSSVHLSQIRYNYYLAQGRFMAFRYFEHAQYIDSTPCDPISAKLDHIILCC